MKKNRSARLPVKLIVVIVVIFIVLTGTALYGAWFFSSSDYFKIKNIIAKEANAELLSYLKGRNIFSIDLQYEAGRILELCPDCRKIRLIRLLPDRIFVDFIKRKPVATIRLYRYFAVDEDGTLFYASNSSQELGVPVISGLESKIFGPKPGMRYNIKELSLALDIIKEMRSSRILKNCKINKIDVSSINNTSIFMPFSSNNNTGKELDSLEVRLGAGNMKDKINILSELIMAAKGDITNVKYIDLRFKEPVIKLKNVH